MDGTNHPKLEVYCWVCQMLKYPLNTTVSSGAESLLIVLHNESHGRIEVRLAGCDNGLKLKWN
jgi:hypothetical protein